jgi:N-acetylglucosaminyl-diphospho-decaprenol L-rhamnosyltransferase
VGSRVRVDVGIVTWNSRDVTVDAIRRLLASDQGCEIRLFVRDNGSTDGTPEAIAAQFPDVVLDAGSENLGFAGGMNLLIARSDAPWFFALNSDAWPEDRCLATLVSAAESHPRAAAAAPLLLRPDGELEHSTRPFPSVRVALMMAVSANLWLRRPSEKMLLEQAWKHDVGRTVDWAVGAALLIRRSALDDLGPFDDSYFMYVEDLEWCWRAHQRGWDIYFEPAAVVRHIGNVSGAARYGVQRTAAFMANTYRFYGERHGRASSAMFRWLNVAGLLRNYAIAKVTRDEGTARFWRLRLPAYRGRGVPQDDARG